MRIGRESGPVLNPEDVAWVAEWQLAAALPWAPLEAESAVQAAPEQRGAVWPVRVRVGSHSVSALLAVRDLAKVIAWCYRLRDGSSLRHPPPPIRRSLLSLKAALRAAVAGDNPLDRMGYVSAER